MASATGSQRRRHRALRSAPEAGSVGQGQATDPAGPGGFGASGKVAAVDATGFPVGPTNRTVVMWAGTTYVRIGATDAKALAVGLCVTGLGKASNTGEITATSIALRQTENGACSSGFGGRGISRNPASTGGGPTA